MSILQRLKKQEAEPTKAMFGIVAGPRLGGKTTLAGTLPGRTLLLQASVLESGSGSARALAAESGAQLDVLNFTSVEELQAIIAELRKDTDFDNVYVDGLSAITEMKDRDPAVVIAKKKVVWDAFRMIGEAATETILGLKELTYSDKAAKPKNVFLTCALKVKHDTNGNVNEVELEAKGNMAVSAITKLGEAVLTVLPPVTTESGTTGHRLVTKTEGFWPGRIDGLLSKDNPGLIEPADLSKVLGLRK